jgi:hypothetical protein
MVTDDVPRVDLIGVLVDGRDDPLSTLELTLTELSNPLFHASLLTLRIPALPSATPESCDAVRLAASDGPPAGCPVCTAEEDTERRPLLSPPARVLALTERKLSSPPARTLSFTERLPSTPPPRPLVSPTRPRVPTFRRGPLGGPLMASSYSCRSRSRSV